MFNSEFRVIIAGGRDFNNYKLLHDTLDNLLCNVKTRAKIIVISGKARGADSLGEKYAIENNFDIKEYPALWNIEGRSAGYKRNERMAKNADALVAFWDGKSKGTAHMIELAKKMNLDYRVIKY